jgi:exonuclease SbcC
LIEKKNQIVKAVENAQKEFNECDQELNPLQSAVNTLKGIVESDADVDISALKESVAQIKKTLNDLREEKEGVVSRIKINNACLNNVVEARDKSQELEEKFRWVSTLSDTANGSLSGKYRVSFETYVQMNYFDRILRRANIRLNKMTNGQYDLIRREDPSDLRSQAGLDIDVLDHYNGSVRPVDSLSGGESFKASLALALGLSDEIQSSAGGVRLDTMFVDEGFGSLDDESLSLAISTLQDLTEGNRLVGIISHVSELKNKIDKQITVTKDTLTGKGSDCKISV